MKAKFLKLFIFFLVLESFATVYFTGKSYAKSYNTVNKIEAKYKNVYSIAAYFYQKEEIPGYSQNMAFKGNFYYKRYKGMAWIYQYPFHKKQILKNGRLYIVNKNSRKVTVINVSGKTGGFPPNVVEVIGNLTHYFKVLNVFKNTSSNETILVLKPIKMQRAKKIYVGFDTGNLKIKSLKIITYQGQTIIFKYKNVKFNSPIKDKIFSVHFPSYYRIIKAY
ncbi:MAG: LolA family protein [Candidatus Acidulodesulfobacterium sp.]